MLSMKATLNVTLPELFSFLGVIIIIYHELSSLSDFLSFEPDFSVPLVSSAIPQSIFAQILSNFYMNNNASVPNNNSDKLYKHSVHPPFWGMSNLLPNFQKGSGLTRRQFLDGDCWEKGVTFFRRLQFLHEK